jgi:TRAP-type C4-dicarboxylate transport system substrate-binding protein
MKLFGFAGLWIAFVVVVAGASNPSPAEAAMKYCDGPKVMWRISLFGPPRANTEGLEYISKYVKENTCGNFDFKLFYGEQLSKAKENLDAIKVGAVEGGFVSSSYHPAKVRALGVLDLPFLPIYDFNAALNVSDTLFAKDALKKSLAKWGARRWYQMLLPHYEYMGRGTPPKRLEDFKGKRLRALGGMGDAAKAIGAVPTTMPAPETYVALQRGTVDAIGLPFSYAFRSYRLDEISTWYTSNLSAGNVNAFIALNQNAWDALPQQYRDMLDVSLDGGYDVMIKAFAEQDAINIPRWRDAGKMAEVVFSDEERARFQKIGGKPVWDAWVAEAKAEVPDAQELLDLLLKTANEANMAKDAKK